jgi:2-iminoacetate synthase
MTFSEVLARGTPASKVLRHFAALIAPRDDAGLEALAVEAAATTRRHFGKTMRLFAPLYLSNECVNTCTYCSFSRENPILRTTLTLDQVEAEARHLASEGFRAVLLVAGEHSRLVAPGFIAQCVSRLRTFVPSVSIEVAPLSSPDYQRIAEAGAEGVVLFQETYDREAYAGLHRAGPKRDFDSRLESPERAYAAGFRRLGIGALLGFVPWREEALRLAAHAEYLLKTCWKASLAISFPRIRPAASGFIPAHPISDRDFVQLICALRVAFPEIGLTLSTREPPQLRDGLAKLGITLMSAGAHTEPGGYTGAGREALHRTQGGRAVALHASELEHAAATVQFEIGDERTSQQVATRLRQLGLDPVWKDWDSSLGS